MYNPYNWKVTKKDDVMEMPVFPGAMNGKKECVLNELTRVSFERDLVNIRVTRILEEIKRLQEEIKSLEGDLEEELIKMHEIDERLIEISHSLPIFEK